MKKGILHIYLIIYLLLFVNYGKHGIIAGTNVPGDEPAAPTSAVGSIPATFAVDKGGAASYKIPIRVPPGITGMHPGIYLYYSSRSENGKVGVGWDLMGISAIQRTKAIMAIDGFSGGVNYDANDRFSLDGQRLININGDYGADQTIYHTEIEQWSKVQSIGQSGSGPDHFIVTTKKGTVMEYGNTTDSKILAQGQQSVRVWTLDKITDLNGNTVTFTYTGSPTDVNNNNPIPSPGDYYISRIDYTSNGNVPSNRWVQFGYESRQDILSAYQGGSEIQTAARLSVISTYVSSTLVKQYKLTYAPQSSAVDRSKLVSIQESGYSSVLPETTFTYQQAAAGYASQTTALSSNFQLTTDGMIRTAIPLPWQM
jgi:hypothetical protein